MSFWSNFKKKHPGGAQFLVFFLVSNGVTVMQLVMMPVLKGIFAGTSLVGTNFQVLPIGTNVDGSQYFIFNYAAGAIENGGGGGLAYFLAVQITLLIAQIINFFIQRNVTFKSKSNLPRALAWYAVAYVVITIVAAALQGLYKAPIYNLFMNTFGMGKSGETIADVLTMVINSLISFWVFYPILKIIFKEEKKTS